MRQNEGHSRVTVRRMVGQAFVAVSTCVLFSCSGTADNRAQTGGSAATAVGTAAAAPNSLGDQTDPADIASLEQRVEEQYRNASLHVALGRAYATKFKREGGQEFQTLLTSVGEYLVAIRLEPSREVEAEVQRLYKNVGAAGPSYQEFRENTNELFATQDKWVLMVVDARADFDKLLATCSGKPVDRLKQIAAEGTRAHLHRVYLIATGREILRDRASGNQVMVGLNGYVKWNQAIRAFGFVGSDALQIGRIFNDRFPSDAILITEGPQIGRFEIAGENRRAVAGLRFFECDGKQ